MLEKIRSLFRRRSSSGPQLDTRTRPIIFVVIAVVVGAALLGFAVGDDAPRALLFAGGVFAVGIAVGFLFGIPRTLQGHQADHQLVERSYRVNTSLEEISDWLTKIIVGIGLTQLLRVPGLVMSLGEYQAVGFGDDAAAARLAANASVYFGICGFLMGYLGTRLFLQEAIVTSDRSLSLLEAVKRIEGIEDFNQEAIETMMWLNLYQEGGYKKVIEIGEQYKDRMKGRPYFWVRLAAAYGQEATAATEAGETDTVTKAKDKALGAVKSAVRLDPINAREDLAQIWNPQHPRKYSSDENDLEVFSSDPDFAALLGPK